MDTWGPPPLAKMTKLFFEMNEHDINARILLALGWIAGASLKKVWKSVFRSRPSEDPALKFS